jgi:hypothetical protein
MLLIVSVRVQDSWCMGLQSVSWDISIPAGVRLLVVILAVLWLIVSDVPIYDGFLDVTCVIYISEEEEQEKKKLEAPPPGVEKKEEEELKEKIDMKVSTKFQINPSTKAEKNALKVIWGETDQRKDQLTNQPTNQPTNQWTKSLIEVLTRA